MNRAIGEVTAGIRVVVVLVVARMFGEEFARLAMEVALYNYYSILWFGTHGQDFMSCLFNYSVI